MEFAGKGGIVRTLIDHDLLGFHYHQINQHRRDFDIFRRRRAAAGKPFHLYYHQPVVTLSRLCHRQHIAEDGLLLHSDIAVFIRRSAAQKGDIHIKKLITKLFKPVISNRLISSSLQRFL